MDIPSLGFAITLALENNIKLSNCEHLLEQYDGDDWEKYVEFSTEKYVKKVVFTNDLIDICVISWNTNQKSCIHDHPSNGCLFKCLVGQLTENLYDVNLNLLQTKCLNKNDISYIEGKQGLHNIANNNYDLSTISLHIYSPAEYIPLFYAS